MSPFDLLFWKVFIGIFFSTLAIFKITLRYSFREMVHSVIKIMLLSTGFLWISLNLSTRHLGTMPVAPDWIGATAGFPFEAFRYPVACMGHDVPPVDQWPNFFLNFAIIHVAILVVWMLYYFRKFDFRFYDQLSTSPNILDAETYPEIGQTMRIKKSFIYSLVLLAVIILSNLFFLTMTAYAFD